MGNLTKNFSKEEFSCPCCGLYNMEGETVQALQRARDVAGIPFKINSASRCKAHNDKVGGVDSSAHTEGKAVDIVANSSQTRFKVVDALLAVGFPRIGIGKTFVHADTDATKPYPVIWLY